MITDRRFIMFSDQDQVKMMNNDLFLSLESKALIALKPEEERDYYRQRFQSMKLVLKELQQQVTLYKTRCSGVNTVALMLKESKQEVIKLTKHCKALETAVANLQHRLSAHGLSSSVSIEETEIFLPGASKQTLDNLAKENARLRTLLKSQENQGGKSSEQGQNMSFMVENLQAQVKDLQGKLSEMEAQKSATAGQYEEAIRQVKAQYDMAKLQLEQQMNQYIQDQKHISTKNVSHFVTEKQSKACQTTEIGSSKIEEVRQALRLLSDQCKALDQNLEDLQTVPPVEPEKQQQQSNMVSPEAYRELEAKLSQVIQMNQRWQMYNENQEQQIHSLVAKMGELEQQNKEGQGLRVALSGKETENQNLKKEISNLNQELSRLRTKPNVDVSLVEILKQQIQVCTEDFNTERKDREHAINKVKQLQDEVIRLTSENDHLKKEIENLHKIKNTPDLLEKRDSALWNVRPQPILLTPRPSAQQTIYAPPQRIPFSSTASSTTPPPSAASSMSPVPSPVPMSFSPSTSLNPERSSYYASSSQDSGLGYSSPFRGIIRQQGSLPRPRGPQEAPKQANVSMQPLAGQAESLVKIRQPDLTCPKCGKEFTESQDSDLLSHINACTE